MNEMRPEGGQVSNVQAFADRVMAGVAREPVPTPARNFGAALRRGSARDAAAALATAWHLATLVGMRITPRVRMRSMALVLSVAAVLVMGGSLATAAAVRVVERATANEPASLPNDAGPGAGEHAPNETWQSGDDELVPTDQENAESNEDPKPAPEDELNGDDAEDDQDPDADEAESGNSTDAEDGAEDGRDDSGSGDDADGDDEDHDADEPESGNSGDAEDDEADESRDEAGPDYGRDEAGPGDDSEDDEDPDTDEADEADDDAGTAALTW